MLNYSKRKYNIISLIRFKLKNVKRIDLRLDSKNCQILICDLYTYGRIINAAHFISKFTPEIMEPSTRGTTNV